MEQFETLGKCESALKSSSSRPAHSLVSEPPRE